jgi:hypothetical protein
MKSFRVLLREDNAVIGMLYADRLAEVGHVVCTIEADVVAAAALCKSDLKIVDAPLREALESRRSKESCWRGLFRMFLSAATPLPCGNSAGAAQRNGLAAQNTGE